VCDTKGELALFCAAYTDGNAHTTMKVEYNGNEKATKTAGTLVDVLPHA
jgi:hypothetical protein